MQPVISVVTLTEKKTGVGYFKLSPALVRVSLCILIQFKQIIILTYYATKLLLAAPM